MKFAYYYIINFAYNIFGLCRFTRVLIKLSLNNNILILTLVITDHLHVNTVVVFPVDVIWFILTWRLNTDMRSVNAAYHAGKTRNIVHSRPYFVFFCHCCWEFYPLFMFICNGKRNSANNSGYRGFIVAVSVPNNLQKATRGKESESYYELLLSRY